MNKQKYNGWNNYQTWVTALWIDNEYGSYQYRCELVEQVKAEHEDESDRENSNNSPPPMGEKSDKIKTQE